MYCSFDTLAHSRSTTDESLMGSLMTSGRRQGGGEFHRKRSRYKLVHARNAFRNRAISYPRAARPIARPGTSRCTYGADKCQHTLCGYSYWASQKGRNFFPMVALSSYRQSEGNAANQQSRPHFFSLTKYGEHPSKTRR